VPPASRDFGLGGQSRHSAGGFRPQPSPLMLRHPFAGYALGLGDLVGGQHKSGMIANAPIICRRVINREVSSKDGENRLILYEAFRHPEINHGPGWGNLLVSTSKGSLSNPAHQRPWRIEPRQLGGGPKCSRRNTATFQVFQWVSQSLSATSLQACCAYLSPKLLISLNCCTVAVPRGRYPAKASLNSLN